MNEENKNIGIICKKMFIYIAYFINCILYPPAKVMFVLWTFFWIFGSASYKKDFGFILFGYVFVCFAANIVYAKKTSRVVDYKTKILKKKMERLQIELISTDENEKTDNSPEENRKFFKIDLYVEDAGRLVIDKGWTSISMLQRYFKIGFNRAERIMDALEKIGVVGKEFGTIPRKILLNNEEYEKIIEDCKNKSDLSNHEPNANMDRASMYNNIFDYMNGHDFEYFCSDILKK